MIKLFSILIIFSLFISSDGADKFKYWELLTNTEKQQYLSDPNVNKIALDYYNGKFYPSDNNKTFKLLKTLTNKNNFNPFYYFLFNQICSRSDGALSEIMGDYCLNEVLNNPEYVINHFTFERMNFKKKQYLYELYGFFIGYEMSFYDQGTTDIKLGFPEFKTYY